MAKLNEGIENIEKGSTLDKLYTQLLTGMTVNAQEKLPDFSGKDYITQDPETKEFKADTNKIDNEISQHTEVMRKNTAYILANSVVTCIGEGGGGSGGGGDTPSSGYLSLSGGAMAGYLNALFKFTAGDDGEAILSVYKTTEAEIKNRHKRVDINGELHLPQTGFYMEDAQVIRRENGIMTIANNDSVVMDGDMSCTGTITLGELTLSKDGIKYKGLDFYHSGNSNKNDVDWTMRNATVAGNISVAGIADITGKLTALGGVDLGVDKQTVLKLVVTQTKERKAELYGNLDILSGGILIDGSKVLYFKDKDTISLSATGKRLILGETGTKLVALQAPLTTNDGEYTMLSKSGDGYFPNSFKAEHASGGILIRTYGDKNSPDDKGMLFPKYIRIGDIAGVGIHSTTNSNIQFDLPYRHTQATYGIREIQIDRKNMSIKCDLSTSAYAPLNQDSSSIFFTTDTDFYVFDKPLEGQTSIGITGVKTRLTKDQLFFGDEVKLVAIQDGMVHYGNMYLMGNISSRQFSSGFAGSGWQIGKDQRTGSIHATFDELTIRKKMRVYELEVQKTSAINGDLWISSFCSGSKVTEII